MTHTNPRTTVYDAILASVSEGLDADAVRGVEDVSVTATEAAARNRYPLLDFEEYMRCDL